MYYTIKILKITDRLAAMKSLRHPYLKLNCSDCKELVDMISDGNFYFLVNSRDNNTKFSEQMGKEIGSTLKGMEFELRLNPEVNNHPNTGCFVDATYEHKVTQDWFDSLSFEDQEKVTRYHNARTFNSYPVASVSG